MAVAVVQVAWAMIAPPFTVPDEVEHFTYVQSLAENGERPPDAVEPPAFSTEARVARDLSHTGAYLADPSIKPAWELSAKRLWNSAGEDDLPRDDIDALGSQANQPPLYYAYEAVPYAAASAADAYDRLLVMRLWSGLLMLVTTAGAWLLIGELTRGDRPLQLAGAACVGLQPMATFVSSGVNPDALLYASYSIAFWLMARLLLRPPARGPLAGLLAVTAAAVLTKPAGLALLPAVTLTLVLLARRRGGPARRLAVPGVILAGAGVLAAGIVAAPGLLDRTPLEARPSVLQGFVTYMWDFYLPRLGFQHEYPALSADNPAWTVWVEQAWASFGFLEVRFPRWAYYPLAGVALAALVGAGIGRRAIAAGRPLVVVLGLAAACLLLGLHWADFQTVEGTDSHRIFQGRYLLPLMPLAGVAVAAAVSSFRARRALVAGVVLGGMAVLQLLSLATVAGRYFA